MSRSRRYSPMGFTLIELVVGMSVMVGIVTAAYLCLHAGLSSQRLLEEHRDSSQRARVAFAHLSADFAAACRLDEETPFLGMNRTLGLIEADNVDFATHNWRPRRPGEGDFCEISYFVDRNPRTGEVGLWRRRDTSPDPEPLSGGPKEEIVAGVHGFKLEYYDGFTWHDTWGDPTLTRADETDEADSYGNRFGMPDAVRITLAFGAGNPLSNPSGDRPPEPPLVFQSTVYLNLAHRFENAYGNDTPGEGDSYDAGDEEPVEGGAEEFELEFDTGGDFEEGMR